LHKEKKAKEKKASKGRTIFHGMVGIVTILLAHFSGLSEIEQVAFAETASWWGFCLDVMRCVLYRILISRWYTAFCNRKLEFRNPVLATVSVLVLLARWFKWFALLLEKILRKLGILREYERDTLSALTPFALGIHVPLMLGVPVYAVVAGVIILSFGDPAARERAKRRAKKESEPLPTVFEGGKKTWMGYRGFCEFSALGIVASSALDLAGFKVYPEVHFLIIIIGFAAGITLSGLAEIGQEWVEKKINKIRITSVRWLLNLLLDDNFVVPATAAISIGVIIGPATSTLETVINHMLSFSLLLS